MFIPEMGNSEGGKHGGKRRWMKLPRIPETNRFLIVCRSRISYINENKYGLINGYDVANECDMGFSIASEKIEFFLLRKYAISKGYIP